MKLFADYRQIHVCSPDYEGDLAEAWTARATDDRVAMAGDIVGIGTEKADDVDVNVEILDAAPALDLNGEHVTESSLRLRGDQLAVLGCTDEMKKAKRFALAKGTWRVRATHTNLAKREKILIQLWPGKAVKAKVITRYAAPAPRAKKPITAPKTKKQAVAAAIAGNIEPALELLLRLHGEGDASASASAAEILAFQGRNVEAVACAKALLKKPGAVYAGNVSDELKQLVAVIEKGLPKPPGRPKPDREKFEGLVADPKVEKRFKGKPRELAQHLLALAEIVCHLDDELIARWDPKHPYFHFEQACWVARALVRRGEKERAWAILESRLCGWYPVDAAQVLPIVLLFDPWLAPLMTPERRALVLKTPRACANY
jgi:hypothetical protein